MEDQVNHFERRRPSRHKPKQLPRIMVRINISLGILLFLIITATLGFRYMTDPNSDWSDALYMTLITITTVGYGEIVPIKTFGERLFVGFVAMGGFGTLTFVFTSFSVFFLEGDLDDTIRRRRMEKQIRKLQHHFIICGFGRVGRNVAHELAQTNRHFVAIDPDENRLQEGQEKYPGLLYLSGDASDDDLLEDAYIAAARGVFAVTGDDSRNLMITLTAKQLNPGVRVVARCNEVRNVDKLKKAGADTVVSPDFTGGMRIASAMIRPQVVSFLDEMLRTEHKLRVEEIVVPDGFVPSPLGELDLRSPDYVLLAVRTFKDWVFNPANDFIVEPGYHLIAMTSPHGRQEMEAALLPVVDEDGKE